MNGSHTYGEYIHIKDDKVKSEGESHGTNQPQV